MQDNRTGGQPNGMNNNMFGGLTGRTTNTLLSNYTSSKTSYLPGGKTSWATTGLLINATRNKTNLVTTRVRDYRTEVPSVPVKTVIPVTIDPGTTVSRAAGNRPALQFPR
jgi:hypothetical protein